VNVSLFGNGIFADLRKDSEMQKPTLIIRLAQNPVTSVLVRVKLEEIWRSRKKAAGHSGSCL
jgi:hypothetical protein